MDKKTSLLVQGQVPEFVREDYPKFISFLKAYYSFLENEQFIDGKSQNNNLTEILKRIKYIGDVDSSLDLFEEQFYNTFLPLLPKDTVVDKSFLIKNVLPLYQSKGNLESFQYLFRLLFGQEIEIEYPRDQVLRASDGKWVVENVLRTTTNIYSLNYGDGTNRTFDLPYEISSDNVDIYVDNVLKEENTHYIFKKELKKFTFNVAPSNGSVIKIVYLGNFELSLFNSRQIEGQTSGSTTIIERVGRRNIGGLNLLQFFINSKNLITNFTNGEIIKINVIVDNNNFDFYLECFSEIEKLNIVEPGSGYNVGDKLVFKGQSSTKPIAIVNQVSSGNLESIRVKVGYFGAGYKVGNNVWANNVTTNNFLSFIDLVDTTGFSSPNTISYNTDLISNHSSIMISSSDYIFPNSPSMNILSTMGQAFKNIIISGLGPATNVIVAITDLKPNTNPTFEANSTIITGTTRVQDVGGIGTIKIDNPGYGYKVGDKVVFSNDYYFSGQGAEAFVATVSPVTGGVTKVTVKDSGSQYSLLYPPKLTIESVSGVGAQISVKDLMGQGAQFTYDPGDGIQGKILSIELLEKGSGLVATPIIDMRGSGDGLAKITAQTRSSLVSLDGRWITSDSILSSDYTKLQGENYYIDFSYVIASKVEFGKYKNIVKNLLNPSGTVNYARYNIDEVVDSRLEIQVNPRFQRFLTGNVTVNVASGHAGVWGTNTYFEVANTMGILKPGSYIKVNSELMVVNSIINNTYLTVSEFYNYDANDVPMIIVNDYDTLLNDIWKEMNIEGNTQIFITTEGVEQ